MADSSASDSPPSFSREFQLEIGFAVVSLAFIAYQLYPLLLGVEPAGWDLSSHLYIYKEFLGNISRGRVHGYDFLWGGGYPTFYLYPPLGYFIAALPHWLSFGLISEIYSFNLSIAAFVVVTLLAFYYAGRIYCGRSAAVYAVIFGMFLLATPPEFGYLGIGLSSALSAGLLSNFMVLPFFILFLAFLEQWRRTREVYAALAVSVLIAVIFCTHTLTFLFTGWIGGWFFLFAKRGDRLPLLCIAALAGALASPEIIGMMRHIPYSSGTSAGLWGGAADPLFPLLEGLSPQRIIDSFTRAFELIPAVPKEAAGGLPAVETPFKIPLFFAYFPFAGCLIVVSAVLGIAAFFRSGERFLPATYLLTLIILPRNFLAIDLPHPIHYYRFIQPLAALQVILCARGLHELVGIIHASRHLQKFYSATLTIFIAMAVLSHNFLAYSLTQRSWLRDSGVRPYRSYFTIDALEYPDRAEADKLMEFLNSLHPQGRVAVESTEASLNGLGTIHFFSADLPRRYGIAVLPGLLIESMLSSSFLISTLAQHSEEMKWGDVSLSSHPDFATQPFSTQLERLKLFGVEYIVTASTVYFNSLFQESIKNSSVQLANAFGPFGLFRLTDPRPLAEKTTRKPFLYVGGDARLFREFAKIWFLDKDSFDLPVIFTPKRYLDLSAADRGSIGGFVLENFEEEKLDQAAFDKLSQEGKPIIILNTKVTPVPKTAVPVITIPKFEGIAGATKLRRALLSFDGEKQPSKPLPVEFNPEGSIVFDTQGTAIIRVSYGPYWQVEQSSRTVFWATPCHILVFSDGLTRLAYR